MSSEISLSRNDNGNDTEFRHGASALPGSGPLLRFGDLRINITADAGMFVASPWNDLDGHEDFLVGRLLAPKP